MKVDNFNFCDIPSLGGLKPTAQPVCVQCGFPRASCCPHWPCPPRLMLPESGSGAGLSFTPQSTGMSDNRLSAFPQRWKRLLIYSPHFVTVKQLNRLKKKAWGYTSSVLTPWRFNLDLGEWSFAGCFVFRALFHFCSFLWRMVNPIARWH